MRICSLSRAHALPCLRRGILPHRGRVELPYSGLMLALVTALPQLSLIFACPSHEGRQLRGLRPQT